MSVKVVFHVDWDKQKRVIMALNNITNLLKEIPDAKVCLVANGSSVKLFKKTESLEYADKIKELAKSGIRFCLCNNSLTNFNITKEELIEECQIVKAGIVELVQLQNIGYAYLKP